MCKEGLINELVAPKTAVRPIGSKEGLPNLMIHEESINILYLQQSAVFYVLPIPHPF